MKTAKEIAKGSTLLATIKSEFPKGVSEDLEKELYELINKGSLVKEFPLEFNQNKIEQICNRIQSEYIKHKSLNWAEIAASKIYSEFVKDNFSLKELREAYDRGLSNIDSDGCHIDSPDEDFNDLVQNILSERNNP